MKICVAVTTKDSIYLHACRTLMGIQHDLMKEGHDMQLLAIGQDSMISRARDTIATIFLESPALKDCSHLLTIDSDIYASEARSALRLLEQDKDVIGGIYRAKSDTDYRPIALPIDKSVTLKDFQKPVECTYIGTGFLMVRREVFERLKPVVEHYGTKGSEIYQFYPCPVKEETLPDGTKFRSLLSEDYGFCNLARENGFRIWGMNCGLIHEGIHGYAFDRG